MTPTVAMTFPAWLAYAPARTLLGWWFAAREDRTRPVSADLYPTQLLPARPSDWASCSRAGVADDDEVLFFQAFCIL